MNIRKVTNEYRTHQWMSIVKECHDSRMSVRAWCKEQGVNEKSFYYWQQKFRKAACSELEKNQETGIAPINWTKLATAVQTPEATLSVEINGCRVIVSNATAPELLTKVCSVLKSL